MCTLLYCQMNCTHLSPFWKSTTDVGTKNPWQQAVAPMPVTSRCDRRELACSIARYVLQVLHYQAVVVQLSERSQFEIADVPEGFRLRWKYEPHMAVALP